MIFRPRNIDMFTIDDDPRVLFYEPSTHNEKMMARIVNINKNQSLSAAAVIFSFLRFI